jgi:hypothetical protein
MREPKKLIEVLQRHQWVIQAQTKDLTHEDSLLQLPFRGNCMNWVLGHIAVNRDKMLPALGQTSLVDDATADLYERDSEPVREGDEVPTLEELLDLLDQIAEQMTAGLEEVSPETLAAVRDQERGFTVTDWIEFLLWHEAYHVGQLEILRQLAGVDDAII